MTDFQQQSNSRPIDPDAVLAELLCHCRSAAEECFNAGRDGTFSDARRIYRLAGVKVVKASLEIIDAMKGKGQATRRSSAEGASA